MHYVFGVILAVVLVVAGVWAYNASMGDRAVKEAQAYAHRQQAEAQAYAYRQQANAEAYAVRARGDAAYLVGMIPMSMVVGGTLVSLVFVTLFGLGFVLWAKNHKPTVVVQQLPPPPVYEMLPKMTRMELLAAVEQFYQLRQDQDKAMVVMDREGPGMY